MSSLRIQPTGYGNQNLILEKLHHEAIAIHSIRASYVPRTFVAEDTVLGEDRLSEFKNAYPIDIYLQNVDGFEGQNAFASKFGLQIQSSANVLISKQGWATAVGSTNNSVLPNRPAEGDLIYIPMTRGLFEIMFVDHQTPFYQLGQYYSYRLTIELFRYSSEKIDTNVPEIDIFEDVHSADVNIRTDMDTSKVAGANSKFTNRADELVINFNNPFGEI